MNSLTIRNTTLIMSWLCFLPLIIVGSVFYEERLNFTIVSLNTVLFLLSLSLFAISIYGTKRHVFLNNYILFFIFFFFGIFSYGIYSFRS
jgi:hypothetical protein